MDWTPYAPIIIAVIAYIIQLNLFARPEDLERKHREILEDARKEFASSQQVTDIKEEMAYIKNKLDKIYDCLTDRNNCY